MGRSRIKIGVITGSRAEYGLLYWVLKGLQIDQDFELQLIVTGMHLAPEYGYTFKEIEKDGFKIDKKIEILLSSDSSVGVSKSMGLAQISFSEVFEELKPNIILILGDRYEIFSAASAAMIANIPIAHCHGGETTEGAYDEAIRHCLTKMSHIHFTSTENYRNRVIQLGEQPERVFNVGALGIESINKLKLLSKKELEKKLNINFKKKIALITFHPPTLENNTAEEQINELLLALNKLENTTLIFTKANADNKGKAINKLLEEFVGLQPEKAKLFDNLGQLNYLSCLKHFDVVIGNSSSGLLEAPSFGIPTVNIGDRQKGRIKAKSIIDCKPEEKDISQAIEKALSSDFCDFSKKCSNPYGNGNSSEKIITSIKKFNLDNISKKKFHDIY